MSRSLFPGKLKKGYLVKSPPLDGTPLIKMFKGWKRRWCVLYLSDGKLYFQYYENEEKSHTGCPKNTLLLEDCKEITFDLEHPDYDNVFSIMLPERTYYFSAVSSFEMVDWVDKIREPLDLKRAASLKVQKSIRRTAPVDVSSTLASSPISPPQFPGASHTLQAPHNSGGISITPPLPPRNSPTNQYSSLAGFCTLPRQPLAKATSIGSSGSMPVKKLRDLHDELPPPPPPPHSAVRNRVSVDLSERPSIAASKRGSGTPELMRINEQLLVPPLPPKPRPPSSNVAGIKNTTTGNSHEPPVPSRKRSTGSPTTESSSTIDANDQNMAPDIPPKPQSSTNVIPPKVTPRKIGSTIEYVNFEVLPEPDKRPVPAPRVKKPIPGN